MLSLRYETPREWTDAVLADIVSFLQDHAANERKVATSALTLASQHPSRNDLVEPLIAVAREELEHFELVFRLLLERGQTLARDAPQNYVGELRRAVKSSDHDVYLRDRLLVFGLIEARACERFGILAEALGDDPLGKFYADLIGAEARHRALFLRLADLCFDADENARRLDQLLDLEAEVIRALPLRAALY